MTTMNKMMTMVVVVAGVVVVKQGEDSSDYNITAGI